MAVTTYTPIANSVISNTSTATVTFTSFSGYTDLRLVIFAKSERGSADTLKVAVNTSTSISRTGMYGNGSGSGASYRQTAEAGLFVDDMPINTSSAYNISTMDFMNYSNSSTYKSVFSRLNNASSTIRSQIYLIPSASPITTITITMNSGSNLGNGSIFSLYGIK